MTAPSLKNIISVLIFTLFLSSRTYAAPELRAINPGRGPVEGGTDLVLQGTGFEAGAQVMIGGAPCEHTQVFSAQMMTCSTPSGHAGAARVSVTNPDGQRGDWSDGYRYEAVFSIGGNQATTLNGKVSLRPKNAHYAPDYVLISGKGKIDNRSATFTASDFQGSALIFAIDPLAGTAEAVVSSYPPITLLAEKKELTTGRNYWFTLAGGAPPFRFSVVQGEGTIEEFTGEFHAPAHPGKSIIQVIDGSGARAEIPVATQSDLAMKSPEGPLLVGSRMRPEVTGGARPLTFSITSGGGTIHPRTGHFTAPLKPGETTVRVTDTGGNFVENKVTSWSDLKFKTESKSTLAGSETETPIEGGLAPIIFSISSGKGTIDAGNGLFTAAQDPGESTIVATDRGGNSVQMKIKTVAPLQLTAKRPAVTISNKIELTASGGFPPYAYSVSSGAGTIDLNGVFSSPDKNGTSVLRVTDSQGNTKNLEIQITFPLELTPPIKTIFTEETRKLYAEGGVPPYQFQLMSGRGAINQDSGLYVAPAEPTVAVIHVTDAEGNHKASEVTVIGDRKAHRKISGGSGHNCAIVENSIRCWGNNRSGQLGDGTQKPSSTPSLVRTKGIPSSVTAGGYHSCALIHFSVWCWGDNTYGQLGLPTSVARSAAPVRVPGLERGVSAIAAGTFHTCAIKNGSVLCWGRNDHEQLGESTVPYSEIPILAIKRGAMGIGTGAAHSCVIFEKGVSCWGANASGQLGNGSSADSSVPVPVNDLHNEPVTMLSAGSAHTCALSNGMVYCWGYNGVGSIGLSGTGNYGKAQRVEGLPHTIQMITSGMYHTCAIVDSAAWCWGLNNFSQIGSQSTDPRLLPTKVTDLPEGAQELAAGADHTCALYFDSARCWGSNNHKQLGPKPKHRLRLGKQKK